MPSQLVNNSAVYFICARDFTYAGEHYKMGEKFDQDLATGQIDLLVLLDVQRSVLASELALSDSRLQQALADVQLYKALGGGLPAVTADATSIPLAARTPK